MKKLFISFQVSSLLISLLLPCTVFANFNAVLKEKFTRFSPESPSNSDHTVIEECGGAFDGSDYAGQRPAKARLKLKQIGDKSLVKVILKNGRPNTLYSVWLRVKGADQDGNAFGGNPLTNGGATPLVPGTSLDALEKNSPWNSSGSTTIENGLTTDAAGSGRLVIRLDFPLLGGSYPFNKISNASLENIRHVENPSASAIPVAIVNPREMNVTAPFSLRIISHCQDDLGHGLSPANRETWFDWPPE
jgi:hypothetical protein